MFFPCIKRWLLGLVSACLPLVLLACASAPSGLAQATVTPTAPVPTISTARLTYSGHSRAANTVMWSPDGKEIASGSDDTVVRIWEGATGHTDLIYRGHSNIVLAVAWSPDGKEIASSDQNGAVQVWQTGL